MIVTIIRYFVRLVSTQTNSHVAQSCSISRGSSRFALPCGLVNPIATVIYPSILFEDRNQRTPTTLAINRDETSLFQLGQPAIGTRTTEPERGEEFG